MHYTGTHPEPRQALCDDLQQVMSEVWTATLDTGGDVAPESPVLPAEVERLTTLQARCDELVATALAELREAEKAGSNKAGKPRSTGSEPDGGLYW